MKVAKACLLLIPAAVLASVWAAGRILWSQIDAMPVRLDTVQGDAAVLDGVRLSGLLQQGWQHTADTFGQWQQEISFSGGIASVQSHFIPRFAQNSYFNLFEQTPEQLENQPYLAVTLEGSNWMEDGNHLRQRQPEELEIGIGSGNFQDSSLYDSLWQAGLSLSADLPAEQPTFTPTEDGWQIDGLSISLTATGPLCKIGSSWYGTVSDTAFWSGGWQPESMEIVANGSQGETDGAKAVPLEYSFSTGLFRLTPGSDGGMQTERIWQLDCTREGSHLLNLCQAGQDRLAVLTVEDGWYQLHSFWPEKKRHTVQKLAPCAAEEIGSAQLEVQGDMLLARLYKGLAFLENTEAKSDYLAVQLTEEGAQLVLLVNDGALKNSSDSLLPPSRAWYTEDMFWQNGHLYAVTGGEGLCRIQVWGQEDCYWGYLRAAGMLEGELADARDNWYGNYLEWAFQSLAFSAAE